MQPITYRKKLSLRRIRKDPKLFVAIGYFVVGLSWPFLPLPRIHLIQPLILAVGFVGFGFAHLYFASSLRNFLRLDDNGLLYRSGVTQHYPWSELSRFALDGASGRIEFTVLDAHVLPSGRPWFLRDGKTGAVCGIDDIYDAPLNDILVKLNECRDRTMSDRMSQVEDRTPQ